MVREGLEKLSVGKYAWQKKKNHNLTKQGKKSDYKGGTKDVKQKDVPGNSNARGGRKWI